MSVISLLIVDDDPVFSRFVCQLVQALGAELPCEVTRAETAALAWEKIGQSRFDLALLDYNLPGRNGLELLDQIRTLPLERQPAVVMLTASGNESVAVEAMKRGAKDYLQKADLDVAPLMRALKSAISQKQLAEQVAAQNARMQADLELARKLHESLLPRRYPSFPAAAASQDSALRFSHRYFCNSVLSGDFFHVQALSDTEAGVFICDVMGHGMRAALVTAMLRAMVSDLGGQARDPGRFLAEMNRKLLVLLRQIEDPLYATAFYLVIDLAGRRFRYAKAGHPLPLHVRRAAGQVAPLALPSAAGAALGLFENTAYVTGECALAPRDAVLLFTDGLFEVVGPQDEEYGRERLLAAARERMDLPLELLLDGLVADVRRFSEGTEFLDDVCLLGMEVA